MTLRRVAAAAGLTVFLVLAGTSAGNAYWSDQVQATASVSAGSITVTQTGFENLSVEFSQPEQTRSAAITVANTGTLSAKYSVAFDATSSRPEILASEIQVKIWPLTPNAPQNCNQNPPPSSTNGTWNRVATLEGILDAKRSTVYCLQTSPARSSGPNHPQPNTVGSVDVSLTLTSALTNGGWETTSVPVGIVQTTSDWTAPSQPGQPVASDTTKTATTLSWGPSTDNVGVVAYDLYEVVGSGPMRQLHLVRAGVTNPYTITGLTPKAHYEFVLQARDAAGNISDESKSVKVIMKTSCDKPHDNYCKNDDTADESVSLSGSAGGADVSDDAAATDVDDAADDTEPSEDAETHVETDTTEATS